MRTPIKLLCRLACILLFCVSPFVSYAKLPLNAVLKTSIPDDPYAEDGKTFRVLCYHDARDNLQESFQIWPERGALATATLIDQFEWLWENGYHVVSLDAILAARNGGPKLPSKPILLTFDDGYVSMYTRIFPLLKLFNYPAVIGLVGEWLQDTKDGKVLYGKKWISRENFVTWSQVREMVASGLVEVGSHSHSLHKGEVSNPQGSIPPSAITRIYNTQTNQYENDAEYMARLRADLAKNSALIARETGKKPRVMIWPFGAYNMLGVEAAVAEGMPIVMNLEAGANTLDQPLTRIRRNMLEFHDRVSELKRNLVQPSTYDGADQPLSRIVGIDLESIYDPNPVIQEKKLGELIERIHRLHINTVYLRPVADLDHDGMIDTAYFPNRHLSVRADLFNRTAWQIFSRAAIVGENFYTYLWLPISAFETQNGKQANQSIIKEIYADAAKMAQRMGGLVMGDALDKDTISKTGQTPFTDELIAIFKTHQPYGLTARLIPLSAALANQSDDAFMQGLTGLMKNYDFVGFSIDQTLSERDQSERWSNLYANKIAQMPGALDATVFLIDTKAQANFMPSEQVATQLRFLQINGARNFGFYPEAITAEPKNFKIIQPLITLHANPGIKP